MIDRSLTEAEVQFLWRAFILGAISRKDLRSHNEAAAVALVGKGLAIAKGEEYVLLPAGRDEVHDRQKEILFLRGGAPEEDWP